MVYYRKCPTVRRTFGNTASCEKTGLQGFRPGPTQTRLYSHRRWSEARNFGFRKKRDCTIYVAKTKALISFVVTSKLICVFVFSHMQKADFLTSRLTCKSSPVADWLRPLDHVTAVGSNLAPSASETSQVLLAGGHVAFL